MGLMDRIAFAAPAWLFPNRRLLAAILPKLTNWRFMLVNGANFVCFKLNLKRSFAPSVVNVEASSLCNLDCPFCYRTILGNDRHAHNMTPDTFADFITKNRSTLTHIEFGMWGEPLMNKRFAELVQIATDTGLAVSFVTNATLMNEAWLVALGAAGVQRITVSVDSIEEEYEALRGTPFDETFGKIQLIIRHKEQHGYEVTITGVAVNEKYTEQDFIDRFTIDGIDRVGVQPLYGEDKNKTKKGRVCYRPWHTAAVFSDGDVSVCAFDQGKELKIGNLGDGALKNIFNSRAAQDIRAEFCNGEPRDICKKCNQYYR